MKRVLTAALLIPVVLLVVFKAPLWLFALAVAGIIVLALHEYLNIAEAAGIKPFRRMTYAVGLLLVYLVWDWFTAKGQHPLVSHAWWMPILVGPVVFGIPLVLQKDLRGGLAAAAHERSRIGVGGRVFDALPALGLRRRRARDPH